MAKESREPELIGYIDTDLAIYWVDISALREQNRNARVMAPRMQAKLTENVKRAGHLESLPLVHAVPEGFEVISGHHRVRAARAAGLTRIPVLAYTKTLPRGQVVAKQLAHNNLQGYDDPATLKLLFEELEDVIDIMETGLDPEDVEDLELGAIHIDLPHIPIEWEYVGIVFLPSTFRDFEAIIEEIDKKVRLVGVVDRELLEAFRETAMRLGRTCDIRSLDAIVSEMVSVTKRWLDQREAEAEGTEQQEGIEQQAATQ